MRRAFGVGANENQEYSGSEGDRHCVGVWYMSMHACGMFLCNTDEKMGAILFCCCGGRLFRRRQA